MVKLPKVQTSGSSNQIPLNPSQTQESVIKKSIELTNTGTNHSIRSRVPSSKDSRRKIVWDKNQYILIDCLTKITF